MRTAYMYTALVTFLACLVCIPSGAGLPGSEARPKYAKVSDYLVPEARLSPREREFITSGYRGTTAAQRRVARPIHLDSTTYYAVSVEFATVEARKAFQAPSGTTVFAAFDRFMDLFLRNSDDLTTLEKTPNVVWIDVIGTPSVPSPPSSPIATALAPQVEAVVHGGVNGWKGKKAIIAIIDTGIDFHNENFLTPDGKASRLLYFWDTLTQPDRTRQQEATVCYPNEQPIGTLYKGDELTADLGRKAPALPELDEDGHGTGCAAVAAGCNSKGKFLGVAPEADLIAVRVGRRYWSFDNAYLLNAICAWLDKVAEKHKRPLIVSCSFGGQWGGHDGHRVAERQLNARFASETKGRILCIAAGNEGNALLHGEAAFQGADKKGILSWWSNSPEVGNISIFFNSADAEDLQIEPSEGQGRRSYIHGLTRSVVLEIDVPPGGGELRFFTRSGKPVTADAYFIEGDGKFVGPCAKRSKTISSPGTATQAVTVGSYDFNPFFAGEKEGFGFVHRVNNFAPLQVGALSDYSSAGPQRITRPNGPVIHKPDIVAPGRYFTAPAVKATEAWLRDSSGNYQRFYGTSAATPYVAGVAALMLDKRDNLTVAQVKQLLADKAIKDNFTRVRATPAPNDEWGNGKLNLEAVRAILDAIEPSSRARR